VRSGNLAEAEHTWTELRARAGSRMDEASCHTLMNAYAQRGHLRRALSLYARMKEWRVRPSPHTFSILFNAYANLAQPSPSYLPKLKQLKDQEMPRYAVGSLRILCACAIGADDTKLITHTRTRAQCRYGVAPSVEIYNVLLKAYLALDPEKSNKELKNVIDEMKEHGLKPDAITYTLWMATAARGVAGTALPLIGQLCASSSVHCVVCVV
jgi:pentatricopeptide repeat protein